ncbi:hypothetical protein B0J13DRAFT_519881 [Dactylonectria estremocensis]|uniref:SnoaL-like domain-containing protein n=1 Tax=Dactylonectria estremocensis TaxID=1079267 RepID=A0A9P9JGA4_9HYPO|nr:hypothetical protein B0J13DRAFT_519881 [Dactylonectria estremocensis]
MRASVFVTLCVSTLAWAGSATNFSPRPLARTPNCPPRPATPKQQRVLLEQFIQTFFEERNATKALLNHVAEDYIQHNPNALSGRQNALDFVVPIISSDAVDFTIMHKAFDGGLAYVHYRMDVVGREPAAVVDVFRFNGTCIVEHWDVGQERDPGSINPLALF